jgi:seryl-tRNA synthetase
MLEIKLVRENLELVKTAMQNRGTDFDFEAFQSHDARRKRILFELEELRRQRNSVSDQIAEMKRNKENADAIIEKMRTVSTTIKGLEKEVAESETALDDMIMSLPNIPHESVPVGRDENDNPVVKTVGEPKTFTYDPLPHWTIGENLGILDFTRAAKIAGARFPLYLGRGARLERALINFMLDLHTGEHGYKEVLPPFIVNRKTMTGTGQLPKFEEDLFKLENLDYFLIPTAEVPVTNIHQEEVLDASLLPVYYTAYTPCFRSEAGSYGKDTRGLIRQHQFNKVELVKFTRPETSYDELETLLDNAETVLRRLELPYRVIDLCTGISAFRRPKPTTSKSGCPPRASTGKFPRAAILKISRPDGPTSASRKKGKRAPVWCIPSTAAAWPSAGPWRPCWRTVNRRTAASSSRKRSGRTWAEWK